jgi:hypothetical protein
MRRERERSLKRSGDRELKNGYSSSRFADIVDPISTWAASRVRNSSAASPLPRCGTKPAQFGWPSPRKNNVERVVDLVVPIGAILVIFFSIGSIFYGDGQRHPSPPSPHLMKAYRTDPPAAQP